MSDTTMTAESLRKCFKAIPSDARHANEAFSIRVWRGISWLERSEQTTDADSKFIALWIAFNAIYGQAGEYINKPDRSTWQEFIAEIVRADKGCLLQSILRQNQLVVLKLIDTQYLFKPFWLGHDGWESKLDRAHQKATRDMRMSGTTGLMQELFERLYVLRSQVFHGAATAQSRLNRECLESASDSLAQILPVMIGIMLDKGPEMDWGDVCFPPVGGDG